MKKLSLFLLVCVTHFSFAQEKKTFQSLHLLLSKMNPNASSWVVVHQDDGKAKEIVTNVGSVKDFTVQESGFKLDSNDKGFYYIAYKKGKSIHYIKTLNELAIFIGNIDSAEEAALKAISEGYFVDLEFKNIAGSHTEDALYYHLDIGKITSKKCPFEKRSYRISIHKSTGKIEDVKALEKYQEIYLKDCKNNPHRFIPPKKKKKKKVISIYG